MVVRQFNVNRSKHIELREAFVLLQARGYTNQALKLYDRCSPNSPKNQIEFCSMISSEQ